MDLLRYVQINPHRDPPTCRSISLGIHQRGKDQRGDPSTWDPSTRGSINTGIHQHVDLSTRRSINTKIHQHGDPSTRGFISVGIHQHGDPSTRGSINMWIYGHEDPSTQRSTNTGIHQHGAGIARLVERRTEKPGAVLTRVRIPGAARDFYSRVSFWCRLSDGVRTALVCNRMHPQHLIAR